MHESCDKLYVRTTIVSKRKKHYMTILHKWGLTELLMSSHVNFFYQDDGTTEIFVSNLSFCNKKPAFSWYRGGVIWELKASCSLGCTFLTKPHIRGLKAYPASSFVPLIL